jgi:integrase
VDKREVEQLRLRLSARVTPEQLAAATAANTSADSSSTWTARKGRNLMSDAVDAFIADQSPSWARDHARRVRAACDLFVELSGDRPVVEVDRDHLRQYRDTLLPAVPARENKVRLRYGTSTVSESIQVVSGTEWPTLSQGERDKRMQWLALLFAWLHSERWVADNPAVGLARPRRKSGERKTRDQDKRDPFTDEDLQAIFSAPWFRTGRGELTKNGTYREFLPFYYWLPLLGLFTGARINELCQLAVTDLRRSGAGVWFIDINDEDEHKKVKTANAIRRVPVHPFLLECGLDRWHEALSRAGYRRLFPELKRDSIKGHSKGAVRWFSDYLGRQGIPRDNRKVFHSFRHGLTTLYTNELGVAGEVVNQLEGWSRGKGVRESTYRKDELPDRLIESVRRVKFNLPPIAPFDTEAGLKAVRDTLRRKNGGRGAAEDCSPPGPTS